MTSTRRTTGCDLARRAWAGLQEPRRITVAMVVAYLLCIAAGAATLHESTLRLIGVWGPRIETTWAWMLILGGTMGALSVPRGIWGVERSGLWLTIGACLIYAMTTAYIAAAPGNQWLQAAFALMGATFFCTRLIRIRGAALDPTR